MTARVPPPPSQPLDRVLALRPTNVVLRLGPSSRLPVLNPRDLLAAQQGTPAVLICVPAFSRAQLGGILRASRDEDAVVGIACPHPLGDRENPVRFVEAVRDAAEEVRHRKPLFLQAGPFRVRDADARTRQLLSSAVYKYVDAGFTLISLDASALGVEEAVAAYRELGAAALERELSIEITAPLNDVAALDGDALREILGRLAKTKVQPNFVRVPGRAYALEPSPKETWQLDLSVLKEAEVIAQEFGAALSIEEEGSAPDQLASAWLDAGVRKADLQEASARIVLGHLDGERSEKLAEDARSQGLHPRDLLATLDSVELDAKAQLKLEALSWAMTVDALPAAGGRGSASQAVAFLSQPGRY